MNQLKYFITKETWHIIRDKRTLLILFVMPIILVILFGFVISTDIRDIKIAVLDHAKDELSLGLTNKLTSSGYFQVVSQITSEKEVEQFFRNGKVKMVVVFPPDFAGDYHKEEQASVKLLIDASDLNLAQMLAGYSENLINEFSIEENRFIMTNPPLSGSIKMLYNNDLRSMYMFIPGVLALIMIIVSAMMMAVSISKEKETGTMRVLLISPLRPITIIIGKVVPYLGLSLFSTMTILILSYFVFNMPMVGSLWLLILVCVIFIFTALSLGILIGVIASSQQIAIMISLIGLFLPTSLLSGFIYPFENMPEILQVLSSLFPAKWFIEAVKSVMIKGCGFSDVWVQLSVLLLMTAFYISVSIRKFKIN